MKEIQRNSLVTVEIEDLVYGGLGMGRVDGFVVFVEGALPGDVVKARIGKKSKNHAQATVDSFDRLAPNRVTPPCAIFDVCGGCVWQDLPYEDQLVWKGKQVRDTLERLGGIQSLPELRPMIPSPSVWNYRNKMEFTFGQDNEGQTILGFHEPGRFDRIFNVPKCLIHPEPFDSLLNELTAWARESGLPPYQQRGHSGFLRHAVMRHSHTTGGALLILCTASGELPDPSGLARRLKQACPALQGFVWGLNDGLAEVAVIRERRFVWGDPTLTETINGLTFKISPESFFQTNTAGAEKLYQVVMDLGEIGPHDTVMDAFCGAGAIGLHCAKTARRVVGVEVVREAVWDARSNARANGVDNCVFISAPMNEGMELARAAAMRAFTRVIVDPPRGGMDKKSLITLAEVGAPVFIYVSCNPATLARDLQILIDRGYVVDAVQPVDMFPHTYHIETVVRLRRSGEPPAPAPDSRHRPRPSAGPDS